MNKQNLQLATLRWLISSMSPAKLSASAVWGSLEDTGGAGDCKRGEERKTKKN